ncbi:ABC transporter ATP-binding protein [Prolixibacter sp. SD074]|uniref:ABC transporter ATP-binding protein n=1 Tax=Prolixibacter sp. SD074 TaxID=2652391 RepID=UPI001286F62E|nr:ABC transporter ATP-binding protein [Prolixibacter sp. SD074]GET28356.1 ATP-binding protein [Prolixibacter sp. SD074]
MSGGTTIKLDHVSVGYRDSRGKERIVKSGISLGAEKGELVALIGGNGIGKSTLLRTLAGFQPPLSGDISVSGKSISAYREKELATMLSFVSTEIIRVANLSVFEMVALGRFPHTNWFGKLTEEDLQIVNESIRMVGLDGYQTRPINQISDGERQRGMIARTLAQDTDIIVLDEPTAFLDVPNKYEIVSILHHLAREKNKTIIFSTHDLNIAVSEVDMIWLMLQDDVVQGAPEDLILNGQFPLLFQKSDLTFDMEKGDFRIKRHLKQAVRLTGTGSGLLWTQKALERNGLEVTNGADTNIEITVRSEPSCWQVRTTDSEETFYSVYHLCRYLREL